MECELTSVSLCDWLSLGLFAVAVTGGVAVASSAFWEFLKSLPWLELFTAAGTVGAVVVALWQTRKAHRREDLRVGRESTERRAAEMMRAELAARRYRVPIQMAANQLHNLAHSFALGSANPTRTPSPVIAGESLTVARTFLGDLDLVVLYPLSPDRTRDLAEVIGSIEWQAKVQVAAEASFSRMSPQMLKKHTKESHDAISHASRKLDGILKAYEDAIIRNQLEVAG